MLEVEMLVSRRHDREAFRCGELSLDAYLVERAAQHYRDGISTTHVLVDTAAPQTILGYYSLSAAQLQLGALQEADQRRLPKYPVPAIRVGRLAVALTSHKMGYGDFLLGHIVARCLSMRETLGVRVVLVDALHDTAANFYRAYGFRDTVENSRTLYLALSAAKS